MTRLVGPRISAALTGVLLVAYTFYLAPYLSRISGSPTTVHAVPSAGSAQPVASTEPQPRELFPPDDKAFIGVGTAEGWRGFGPVDAFATAARHKPSALLVSESWAVDRFDRDAVDQVAARGMQPMLSWEPWDHRVLPGDDGSRGAQPAYTLARIISGEFDPYIRSYAEGIKDLKYEVAIRFAYGMNGPRYPWSEQSNGNRPGEYVQMWRHVHDIFTAVGATNVLWVWSGGVSSPGSTRLASLYPGDDYVDWVGLSGYYAADGNQAYQTFGGMFDATIAEMRTFTRKPLVITEIGASDRTGRKAEWIRDMFAQLGQRPDIVGFIWSETTTEADWRIATPPAAADAFANGAADPRYRVTWSPNALGRDEVEIRTVAPVPSVAPSAPLKGAVPDPARPRTTTRPRQPAPTATTAAPKPSPSKPPPPPPTSDPPPTPEPTKPPDPSQGL